MQNLQNMLQGTRLIIIDTENDNENLFNRRTRIGDIVILLKDELNTEDFVFGTSEENYKKHGGSDLILAELDMFEADCICDCLKQSNLELA